MMTRKYKTCHHSTKVVICLLLVVAMAAAATGCFSKETPEKVTTPKKTANKATTTADKPSSENASEEDLKVEEGDVPGTDVTDLPRYPGSIRQSDTVTPGATGKQSGVLIYQTADELPAVLEYYLEEIDKQDWTLVITVETKEGKILQVTKGTRKASINIAQREGIDYTDVTIQYREF